MLSNLFLRHRDPTRDWLADPSRVSVDVSLCTLCGVALGGDFACLSALGPSEDAGRSAQGLPDWLSQGVYCTVDEGRLADFALVFAASGRQRAFRGNMRSNEALAALSGETTPEQLLSVLGEPFARSDDDGQMVWFYENPGGEAQFTFDGAGKLESIEFLYEPELAESGALGLYRIDKPFPDEFRRSLQSSRACQRNG